MCFILGEEQQTRTLQSTNRIPEGLAIGREPPAMTHVPPSRHQMYDYPLACQFLLAIYTRRRSLIRLLQRQKEQDNKCPSESRVIPGSRRTTACMIRSVPKYTPESSGCVISHGCTGPLPSTVRLNRPPTNGAPVLSVVSSAPGVNTCHDRPSSPNRRRTRWELKVKVQDRAARKRQKTLMQSGARVLAKAGERQGSIYAAV